MIPWLQGDSAMPFELKLRRIWSARRWKAKIRDREGPEEPHVSLIRGTRTWRLSLRTAGFLDCVPPPGEVPVELLREICLRLAVLRSAWDRIHPENPVREREDADA